MSDKKVDNKKETTKTKKKKIPFVFSVLRFFSKVLTVLIFLIYLMLGGSSAWSWVYTKNVREVPLSEIYGVIQNKRNADDLRGAMAFLKARKLSEHQEIIDILSPHLGELEPFFSFIISRFYLDEVKAGEIKKERAKAQAKDGTIGDVELEEIQQEAIRIYEEKMPEAVFWSQAAKFRLRYDSIRCGHLNSRELSDKVSFVGTPFEIDNYFRQNPDKLKPILQRVLDWDKQYDKIPRPDYLCRMMDAFNMSSVKTGTVPEERWEDMRYTMHVVTEFFINSEEEASSKRIDDILETPPLSGMDIDKKEEEKE